MTRINRSVAITKPYPLCLALRDNDSLNWKACFLPGGKFCRKWLIDTLWIWPIRSLESTLKHTLNAQNHTKTLLIRFKKRDVSNRKRCRAECRTSNFSLHSLLFHHLHRLYDIIMTLNIYRTQYALSFDAGIILFPMVVTRM